MFQREKTANFIICHLENQIYIKTESYVLRQEWGFTVIASFVNFVRLLKVTHSRDYIPLHRQDEYAVPSLEQVIQGNNKCERQQHSLRGLNWIALTFYKATNCLFYSSAWVFAFWSAWYKDTLKFDSGMNSSIWTVSGGAGGKAEGHGPPEFTLLFPFPRPRAAKRKSFYRIILKEQVSMRMGPFQHWNVATASLTCEGQMK